MFSIEKEISGGCIVALGTFDGLHLGHRAVLEKALAEGKKRRLVPIALLFDEHPKKFLCKAAPPELVTPEEKKKMLREMGFTLVTASFSELHNMTAREFLLKIYCTLGVRAISCGYNYHFGKDALGNTATLKTECEKLGIALFVAPQQQYEGEAISSTRIRALLENGEIRMANAMLGREFSYCFEVVSGDRRGRLLGFPTINQFFPEGFVRLRRGVYASKVCVSGEWHPAVTNIGVRPTVDGESFRSETCIFGFSGDLYGLKIEVLLLDFLRDETKFDSLEALTAAIRRDGERAVEIYKEKELKTNE